MRQGLLRVFLVIFCLSNPCSGDAECDCYSYRQVYTANVIISQPFATVPASSSVVCGIYCRRLSSCRSFAFTSPKSACRLYDHFPEFSRRGQEENATTYYWMLSQRCPVELGYSLEAGICYKVYADKVSQDEGHKTCAEDGGHLFIGDQLHKLALLVNKFPEFIWLGASDVEKEGEWYWLDGNRLPLQSELWKASRPNNLHEAEHHGMMVNLDGRMDDAPSNMLLSTACQIPM